MKKQFRKWWHCTGVFMLVLVVGCGCTSKPAGVSSAVPASETQTTEEVKKPSMNILVIGDSNTEYGHITGPLERILESEGTGYANGYRPLSDKFASQARNSVSVKNDSNWKLYDMTDGPIDPTASPCGIWATSNVKGAATSVKFKGTGADFYYLKQQSGGTFMIEASGCDPITVDTSAQESSSAKASIQGLEDGLHTVKLIVQSGTVTLQGFVPWGDECTAGVVHNWGNAGANSRQFAAIDETVFVSAVKELNPNYVVVLLGTNDWFPADEETKNLSAIVQRVQKAVPDAHILLTSTFDIDYADARKWMTVYLKDAYPVVAQNTGCSYWNMHDWFGSYDESRMLDGWHCNDISGKKIAQEMLNQLKALDS